MERKENNPIVFLRKKDFVYKKDIGQGGTGKTILIEDTFINQVFVCKKYAPFYEELQELYFKYFLDEIKILHTLYHKNIVRVFNYYLYPDYTTGYIIMEYIDGKTIDVYLEENPDKFEDIFQQTIDGFKYLEENNILHRDIRPGNILVSEEGIVKIIDFGFGKTVHLDKEEKSITLAWNYTVPDEFQDNIYDATTEVYFVGKLFEKILQTVMVFNFRYDAILDRMVLPQYRERISSFLQVYRAMLDTVDAAPYFDYIQRTTYLQFANYFTATVPKLGVGCRYVDNMDQIMRNLNKLYSDSMLEYEIQNNKRLIEIFIIGNYGYNLKPRYDTEKLGNLITLLKSCSPDKRKIILNNLWQRFDSIPRYNPELDLPF